MSKTLLVVHHTPSPFCQAMFEAVLAGAERNRFALDRRDAVRLRMAWLPGLAVLPALIWTALAGLGRALGWLALKRPERSAAELAAASDVWLRPQVWWRLRRGRRGRRGRAVRRDCLREARCAAGR